MERIDITSGTNITKLDNGFSISAAKVDLHRPKPGDTALHEAKHIIPYPHIVYSTNIPNGHAEGETVPVKITAAAAAGPASDGHGGVGHDLNVIVYQLGVDIGTGMALGHQGLKGKEEEVIELATVIEEKGIIYQSDVNKGFDDVRKRGNGIFVIEVQISSPDGKTNTFKTESVRGEISIKDDLLQLPKAA